MKRLQVFIGALFFLLNIQAQERIKWNQNIDSLSLSYPIIFVDGIEISDDDMAKLDPTDMISVNVIKEGPIYDLVAPRKGKIMIIKTKSKDFLKQWLVKKQYLDEKRPQFGIRFCS
ncbi:MAG: hypothetical protein KBG68_12340 [Prevotella sp.]|nr:hypothetical protein [Prevotella sp.]